MPNITKDPARRRASLPQVRRRNLSVVARAVCASTEPPSRASLAGATGLTKATTSRLAYELIDGGVLEESAADEGQVGRPATPLLPAARTMAGLGLEVNVSYLAGKAMDLSGTTLASFKVPHDTIGSTPALTLERLGRLGSDVVTSLTSESIPVVGAKLAIPGPVSGEWLLAAPNLGWEALQPLTLLGEDWPNDIQTSIENDAKLQCLTASMSRPGLTVLSGSYLYLAGDIGIGSAVVYRGRVLQGEHGWAGEIGHMSISPRGPKCTCGARGCLEAVAGQAAIRERAQLPPDASVDELLSRLKANDRRAVNSLRTAGKALGVAIANAINLLDVSIVVLGSGLSSLTPWLKPMILRELDARVLRGTVRGLMVLAGPSDEAPATTGGALAVLEAVLDDPAGTIARAQAGAQELSHGRPDVAGGHAR